MSQGFWSLLTWLQVFFSVQMCPDDEQPHHFVGSDIKNGEHDLVSSNEQIQSKPAWSGYPPGWWIVKEWHTQIYLTISFYNRYKTIWYNWLYIFMCVKHIFDLLLVMYTLYIPWLPRSQMTLVFAWSSSLRFGGFKPQNLRTNSFHHAKLKAQSLRASLGIQRSHLRFSSSPGGFRVFFFAMQQDSMTFVWDFFSKGKKMHFRAVPGLRIHVFFL